MVLAHYSSLLGRTLCDEVSEKLISLLSILVHVKDVNHHEFVVLVLDVLVVHP